MSRQGYAVITILKCSFCSTGKLVSEEIQNGPPRRDASTIPLVLYICSGHDDQDLFSVWKDEESERPSITAAISVGDALPIWHSWRRGKGLVCCFQYFCPPEEFVLKQLILHQRRIFSQEVSGGRNYPQPDNIACLSSHIPSVYIPVLYCLFFFFFPFEWTGWKLFRMAIWGWYKASYFLQQSYLLSFGQDRKGGILNSYPFIL